MKLVDLPVTDIELVRAFAEIAREECRHVGWITVEPALAKCWQRSHGHTGLTWEDVVPFVRSACDPDP